MKIVFTIAVSGISALFLIISGCGKNTTGNNIPQGTSGITIRVQDDSGLFLPGFTISTQPTTRNTSTDSTGFALIEKIPDGKYEVVAKKSDFSDFSKVITVDEGEIVQLLFTYLQKVTIVVRDEKGRLCPGAEISTYPPTFSQSTDNNGTAIFKNMPQRTLDFTVKRANCLNAIRTIPTLTSSLELTVQSSPPVTSIISPVHGSVVPNSDNVALLGSGYDLEDGELPDSSLVWNSDRDGILGSGKTLVVPHLSPLTHIITLRGNDSDNKSGETSIQMKVIDSNSYFPIPQGETWSYRYLNPDFSITNSDNSVEHWTLKNISVRIGDNLERTTDVYWDITVGTTLIHYHLTLTDYLEVDGDNLYVTKTEEHSEEWKGKQSPYLTMDVTTIYTPRYLFLKNSSDVLVENNYESTVSYETSWSYVNYSDHSETYHESGALTTSIQVEDVTSIQTNAGIFSAANLTITQNNAVKKWSFTKGIGLVRIEDNTFNPSAVAELHDASILSYYEQPAGKNVFLNTGNFNLPMHPDFKIDRTSFESMKAVHKFLTGMCPR
ncbi:MAG: carboxypeptidase-like regulatory domain-containing protein [Candidatus Latescibacterota bacterium]